MVEKMWVCQLQPYRYLASLFLFPFFWQISEKKEKQRAFRQIAGRICLCAYLHVALNGVFARWRRPSSKSFWAQLSLMGRWGVSNYLTRPCSVHRALTFVKSAAWLMLRRSIKSQNDKVPTPPFLRRHIKSVRFSYSLLNRFEAR